MKAAQWVTPGDGKVQCSLCPHSCNLKEGQTGICGIRGVLSGELVAFGYGLVSSTALDPIEKKPLSQFHPGSAIFSIGGWGCNLSCFFCQNWTISQQVADRPTTCSPEDICSMSGRDGSIGVAYTYNEPLINYEFVLDCAQLVRDAGRLNVLVTNGYIQPEPAAKMLPFIDALNIDIKSMSNHFYKEHCGGSLQPVLDFAVQAKEAGCHVEITNLLIPGLNDSDEDVKALAEWIHAHLGKGTPLHLSAYFPNYKCEIPRTSVDTMKRVEMEARAVLDNVYLGNV